MYTVIRVPPSCISRNPKQKPKSLFGIGQTTTVAADKRLACLKALTFLTVAAYGKIAICVSRML